MPNKQLFMSHNSTQLTACSFFLAALANSERSRLENTEDKSQKGKTERQWNKEMERERGREGARHGYGKRSKRWKGGKDVWLEEGGGVQGLGGQIYVGWEALGAMATDIWNLKASLWAVPGAGCISNLWFCKVSAHTVDMLVKCSFITTLYVAVGSLSS